jgi:hypothetical protein
MGIKTFVSPVDQLTIEPFFADTGLIACNQENGFTVRVESESHPPNTVSRVKS